MENNTEILSKQNGDNKTQQKGNYDQIGKIFSGISVIWLGISFLLMNHYYFFHCEWWSLFLFGLGIIFFVEAIIRIKYTDSKQTYVGKIIAGAVLVAIGAGSIYGMEYWWPLILIAVGVVIIFLSLKQKV